MRILHVVAGSKWTGAAAVVHDWTRALLDAGVEAQFAFTAESPLARRVGPDGWGRPLLSPSRGPIGMLSDVRRLRETVRRERFDLVHTHLTHDHYVAVAALSGLPARLVRTIHNLRHVRRDPVARALHRRTAGFAFANREIAAAFAAAGPVHSPAVDTARFSPRKEVPPALRRALGVPEGACVLGTVGKLARGRGHEETIAAAAALGERVALLHVGKGEHRPALEARAAALGVGPRNLWAGYEEERLPDLYRALDVFVFPASGAQQGQRAILEAMASGLPVVALEAPGVADLVTDGVEGIVARDIAGLTDALQRLVADAGLRARMGEAARRRALEFTPERFARAAIRFYEEIGVRP